MNTTYTDVTVLLDKSQSMAELVDETIGGFNGFLDRQKQNSKDTGNRCEVQLIQFDNLYEPGPRYDVIRHPALSRDGYTPRGNTALLDALGRAIDETGKRLAAIPEDKRPGKVLFVVLTDGLENASQHFSAQQIREKITLQQDAYRWDFIYLGANQDAWAVGQQYGFQPGKTLSTAGNAAGTQHAFRAASAYVVGTTNAPSAAVAMTNAFAPEDVAAARHASNTGAGEAHI